MIQNKSSHVATIIGDGKQTIFLPQRNKEELTFSLKSGESIEIIYPKNDPWLDWQVNLPDNKPKNGSEVIAKFFGKYLFKYDTVIFLKGEWFGGSDVGMHDDDGIEKCAYIPE